MANYSRDWEQELTAKGPSICNFTLASSTSYAPSEKWDSHDGAKNRSYIHHCFMSLFFDACQYGTWYPIPNLTMCRFWYSNFKHTHTHTHTSPKSECATHLMKLLPSQQLSLGTVLGLSLALYYLESCTCVSPHRLPGASTVVSHKNVQYNIKPQFAPLPLKILRLS